MRRTPTRAEIIQLGVISLAVGLLFLFAGAFLGIKIISNGANPGLPGAFIITFSLSIGAILILIALRSLCGKNHQASIQNQYISKPTLIIVGLFFVVAATMTSVLAFLEKIPFAGSMGRGIGGGFILGFLALWAAFKKNRT
jgi:uncharacterized membrane protein